MAAGGRSTRPLKLRINRRTIQDNLRVFYAAWTHAEVPSVRMKSARKTNCRNVRREKTAMPDFFVRESQPPSLKLGHEYGCVEVPFKVTVFPFKSR